jgi:hypothetical protein
VTQSNITIAEYSYTTFKFYTHDFCQVAAGQEKEHANLPEPAVLAVMDVDCIIIEATVCQRHGRRTCHGGSCGSGPGSALKHVEEIVYAAGAIFLSLRQYVRKQLSLVSVA